jgi:hypothetical protein
MSVWPCFSRSGSSTILLPSVLTQAISGLFVAQPTCIPSAKTATKAESCRRRWFMGYTTGSSFPYPFPLVTVAQKAHTMPTNQITLSMRRGLVGRGSMSRAHVTAGLDDDATIAFLMFCLEIYQAEQQRKRKLH